VSTTEIAVSCIDEACMAGVERGGRGGNYEAQSTIRGRGKGMPTSMPWFLSFCPQIKCAKTRKL